MRPRALFPLLLILLTVFASGCTSGGTNTTSSGTETQASNSIGSADLLLVITNDNIHSAYLVVRNGSTEILVVPYYYSVGLKINGDEVSIEQKDMWVFQMEPNDIVRVEKLKSDNGFTFKAKKIYGDTVMSESFNVQEIPNEYRKLLNGLPYYEPLDKLPDNSGVARKIPLSELAQGITIDEIINGYAKLNDSEKLSEFYKVFTLQSGGTGSSDTLYTGEIVPILRAKLFHEYDMEGTINQISMGDTARQRFAVVAIPKEALSENVDVELRYDPNSRKGTIKVAGLKTTDGYAIVVTLG
ncbi:hypothetical protein CL1_0945 [Thermococcus cleftensis]|uniref:Uncharacterized protein n=1 Tax=Thermococcus cleftensis (strain DSM 27260 / KACC 17922 / CL1) TaxID=163003 RepID=I3ZTW5_THECF|nr:hypothetical protein [Thermococcus cleftensis]AFL95149.1 hypothetical protein CL1_0945 [Thermococcus cleftensis]